MNCTHGHRMWNYDDINFECRQCGEVKYRVDADRIALLLRPKVQGGMGRPSCPVCGRVSVPNNGGFTCIHCSAYWEAHGEGRNKLLLMPHKAQLPVTMVMVMVILYVDLYLATIAFLF